MSTVFVSYARTDYEMAKELAEFLALRGYDVWWDVRLVGSDEFRDTIQEQLIKAAAVIVIWSQNSAVSRFVRQEADEALHRRKLIATRVRGFDVRKIPLGFREQHTDYVDEREKLEAALMKMGARPSLRPLTASAAGHQETPSVAEAQSAWARPFPERWGELGMVGALLATAVFFIWQAALLPFGRVGLPGPGFFPFALGIALALLALAILFVTLRGSGGGDPVYVGHRDVLVVLAALAGVAVAFERADSYLTLGLFAAALLLLVARASPLRVVLGASLGMVAVWAFFNRALGVRLPVGEFWEQIAGFIAAMLPSAPF